MSEFEFPQAKLPDWSAPFVRQLPEIPNVGKISGDPNTIIGRQMGNFPDLIALPHIRSLKKIITEQIGALIDGQLPQIPRAPKYAQRAQRLVSELSAIVNSMQSISSAVEAEANAAIGFANQKLAAINQAKNEILSIPENARTAVQRKAVERYNEYAGELTAQAQRLGTGRDSFAALAAIETEELMNQIAAASGVSVEYLVEEFTLGAGQTSVELENEPLTVFFVHLNHLPLSQDSFSLEESTVSISETVWEGAVVSVAYWFIQDLSEA